MIYSSPEFFIFFVILGSLYALLSSYRLRFLLLLVASLVFYLWTGLADTLLFLVVVVGSWLAVWTSEKWSSQKKGLLAIGIVLMLLHLFFWKYAAWLFTSVGSLFGLSCPAWILSLPLPVGISFFTLQGVAYLIDYAKGDAKYIPLGRYTLFKAFFCQLIAGPIVRVSQLLPQLEKLKRPVLSDFLAGSSLFAMGFLKKMLVADSTAPFVDKVFENPSDFNRSTLLLAAVAYAAQIWADFSGYTDMGRGSARMLGIRLPQNFLAPYLAQSPSEFWKRWHITLSEWIRDYLYIPLGGRRGGLPRRTLVVVGTMAIAGLWHGASWTFVIWGFLHGILLVSERTLTVFTSKTSLKIGWVPKIILTQAMVFLGWIFFRATSLENALTMIHGIGFSTGTQVVSGTSRAWMAILITAVFHAVFYFSFKTKNYPVLDYFKGRSLAIRTAVLRHPVWATLLGVVSGGGVAGIYYLCLYLRLLGNGRHFIYFQF